jgi:hypothetical protein
MLTDVFIYLGLLESETETGVIFTILLLHKNQKSSS